MAAAELIDTGDREIKIINREVTEVVMKRRVTRLLKKKDEDAEEHGSKDEDCGDGEKWKEKITNNKLTAVYASVANIMSDTPDQMTTGKILIEEGENLMIIRNSYTHEHQWILLDCHFDNASTFLAMDLNTKYKFVAKKSNPTEVSVLAKLRNNPGIVKLIGYLLHDGEPCLFLEYISGQTLAEKISSGQLQQVEILPVMKELLLIMCLLQKHGVIHNNIKAENFVMKMPWTIVGFGRSTTCGTDVSSSQQLPDTVTHLSPERAQGESGSYQSDVFSLMIVFLHMINGKIPCSAQPSDEVLDERKKGVVPIVDNFQQTLRDFFESGLKANPDERASVEDLIQHPLFQMPKLDFKIMDILPRAAASAGFSRETMDISNSARSTPGWEKLPIPQSDHEANIPYDADTPQSTMSVYW